MLKDNSNVELFELEASQWNFFCTPRVRFLCHFLWPTNILTLLHTLLQCCKIIVSFKSAKETGALRRNFGFNCCLCNHCSWDRNVVSCKNAWLNTYKPHFFCIFVRIDSNICMYRQQICMFSTHAILYWKTFLCVKIRYEITKNITNMMAKSKCDNRYYLLLSYLIKFYLLTTLHCSIPSVIRFRSRFS